MSTPRYRPRSYCAPSKAFGTHEPARWRAPRSIADSDQLGAAQIQHLESQRVRAALRDQGLTAASYAAAAGLDPFRLRAILRGDVIMRLEDIANVRRNLFGGRSAKA